MALGPAPDLRRAAKARSGIGCRAKRAGFRVPSAGWQGAAALTAYSSGVFRATCREHPRDGDGVRVSGAGQPVVGMGRALSETFQRPGRFEEVDDALGERLSAVIWRAIDRLTHRERPAALMRSRSRRCACSKPRRLDLKRDAAYVAGHSLGEYSALAAAASLTVADSARLCGFAGVPCRRRFRRAGAMAALPARVRRRRGGSRRKRQARVPAATTTARQCGLRRQGGGGARRRNRQDQGREARHAASVSLPSIAR